MTFANKNWPVLSVLETNVVGDPPLNPNEMSADGDGIIVKRTPAAGAPSQSIARSRPVPNDASTCKLNCSAIKARTAEGIMRIAGPGTVSEVGTSRKTSVVGIVPVATI